jgi:hypothetical protein
MRMPRALNLLRASLHYRRESFDRGLRAAGFDIVDRIAQPRWDDVLLIWNRYSAFDDQARMFEGAGATVLVVENGWLGKDWRGGEWFALSVGHHAGAGRWKDGGPERWDGWHVELEPWRRDGTETVILGQRGIGERGVRSPEQWAETTRRRIGGRIRPHPGTAAARPLREDLAGARDVATWHSGAALLALMWGVPCWYEYPRWIGAGAGRSLAEWPGEPRRDDGARLATFRRLAWAMWTLDEIRSGAPIRRLLEA